MSTLGHIVQLSKTVKMVSFVTFLREVHHSKFGDRFSNIE